MTVITFYVIVIMVKLFVFNVLFSIYPFRLLLRLAASAWLSVASVLHLPAPWTLGLLLASSGVISVLSAPLLGSGLLCLMASSSLVSLAQHLVLGRALSRHLCVQLCHLVLATHIWKICVLFDKTQSCLKHIF